MHIRCEVKSVDVSCHFVGVFLNNKQYWCCLAKTQASSHRTVITGSVSFFECWECVPLVPPEYGSPIFWPKCHWEVSQNQLTRSSSLSGGTETKSFLLTDSVSRMWPSHLTDMQCVWNVSESSHGASNTLKQYRSKCACGTACLDWTGSFLHVTA